jgi:cytochrome c
VIYWNGAYILNLNGLLPADATLDAKRSARSRCRTMFVGDPRPDLKTLHDGLWGKQGCVTGGA